MAKALASHISQVMSANTLINLFNVNRMIYYYGILTKAQEICSYTRVHTTEIACYTTTEMTCYIVTL